MAPSWDEASALEGMLCSIDDHSGFGDGKICICRKVLSLILFAAVDGQRQAWIDGFIGMCNVVVDIGLADITVSVYNFILKVTDVYFVHYFVGVIEFHIKHCSDGFRHMLYIDIFSVLVGMPDLLIFNGLACMRSRLAVLVPA